MNTSDKALCCASEGMNSARSGSARRLATKFIGLSPTVLLLASTLAFAETPKVLDFRINYRQEPGESTNQEALRGIQRANELQAASGESLTHRRSLKDGTHEMRASRALTRAEAWALAEKMQRANPNLRKVEPIDPDADSVQGRSPNGIGR